MAGKLNAALDRVRHARHPLHGVAKWSLITFQALVALVVLFALANLALSLTAFRGDDPAERLAHEVTALWYSPVDGERVSEAGFEAVHGDTLGRAPEAEAIRAHLSAEAADGEFLLDHVLTDHILRRFGRMDSRTLPVGVYVGVHALGPDGMPFVPVTKYLAHYLLFVRHAYILVVPEDGPAVAFSASQNRQFDADADQPNLLLAEMEPYERGSYDFPSSGQALHDMTLITREPEAVRAALERLELAQDRLAASGIQYGVLAPNSNTVIGCILEDAGAVTREQRSAVILAFRAPGYGAACA